MAADNIYDHLELQTIDDANYEDAEIKTRPTAKEKDLQNILQSDIRRYRRIGVRVGLLCAVLALLNIAVPLYLYQSNMVEREQRVNNYNQLQARNNNLTDDREQLQSSFNQLQTRHNQLTQQKDQLQTSFDQLQTSYNSPHEQKDQLQTSFDQLQNRYKNVTGERDDMKMRLCESPGWQKFGRGCYYISTGKKNWEESRQWCRDRQSDLIVIKSKEKQDFVARVNKRVWLGLTDREDDDVFMWVDGTRLTTPTYWHTGEPSGKEPTTKEKEHCVEYYDGSHSSSASRGWNDLPCSSSYNWICERVVC